MPVCSACCKERAICLGCRPSQALAEAACPEMGAGKMADAPVAQLDRASDYESEGRTFESFRARHFSQVLRKHTKDLPSGRMT